MNERYGTLPAADPAPVVGNDRHGQWRVTKAELQDGKLVTIACVPPQLIDKAWVNGWRMLDRS